MKNTFRLGLSILLISTFSVLVLANEPKASVKISDLDDSEGRVVEVRAQVVAIGADSKSMVLFDSPNKKIIDVRLNHLKEADRTALIQKNVRRVLVTGRASLVDGRVVIDAERVEALPKKEKTNESRTDEPDIAGSHQ